MPKLTNWEKRLVEGGTSIITWEHDEIMDYLLMIFNRDKDHLLLEAAADDTKRHTLCFILDYEGMGGIGETNFGGTVTYDKKLRRFTYITYSDRRNFGVMFSIESRVACFCYDNMKQIEKLYPYRFWSVKRLGEWLLNN